MNLNDVRPLHVALTMARAESEVEDETIREMLQNVDVAMTPQRENEVRPPEAIPDSEHGDATQQWNV